MRVHRPLVLVLVAASALSVGCATQPKPAPASAENDAAEKARTDRAAAVGSAEKSKVEKTPEGEKPPLDLPAYRAAITRELARLTRSREATDPSPSPEEASGGKIPHSTLILKRIGQVDAFVVATIGYGRIRHAAKGVANVELIAYVERYGPNIAKVLSALGEYMHARGPDAPAWKEYDVVMLPKPEQGLQYFDLRPGGQIDVAPDLSVMLLKVVPMSEDEYETAQKNPSNEFDDPNSNARAVHRWRQVLERK
jgi:hypothetical protein